MKSNSAETSYQHYSLKHKVVAWFSQTLFDNVTYTVRHGILKGLRRRGGLGWTPEWIAGRDESEEHRYFRALDLRGKVVYDVGAFVGLFALHCSRTATRVICYEPLDKTRERLTENLSLNNVRNATIRPFAVGRESATLELSFDPLMPGGASLSESVAAGIVGGRDSQRRRVQVTTLDLDIPEAELPPPDFIKIDVEGFELDALIGAQQTLRAHRPSLYLEMHGETMSEKRRNVRAIVEFLTDVGYSSIKHMESGTQLELANTDVGAHGHIVCTW